MWLSLDFHYIKIVHDQNGLVCHWDIYFAVNQNIAALFTNVFDSVYRKTTTKKNVS